jgi:hypothetical protein
MADYKTLLQALLGSGAVQSYATAQPANQLSLPTPPIAQAGAVQPPKLQTIGQMLAPTAAPAGSNTMTGATTPPMFAQPAQQAQAQPVPMAQQSYSTPGPGGNTGALNPMGILGQIIGGQGKVRKPVSISGAFGFGGADNQADDEQPMGDQS